MSRPALANSTAMNVAGPGIYRIGKAFTFEGAHLLGGLPEGHKCGRLHGHRYTVEITLASRQLTGPGFVVDFAELDPLKRHLDGSFDHRLLNDAINVEPTSEHLAHVLFDWCAAHLALPDGVVIEAVRVRETATSWAEYRQDVP
ncbi:6-pyruvoyltetrahydropterin/6-carboxytetrahydropterin synthase [Micromonospora nigra]|uniref:6-carboxy-5,6,7,8-tetrahydropterin synthase n=1 Tax=Micromonospora nigra TaxID=145857 RepID=A0A1C6R7X1_9ACTN|nr:6-carboxytetrahydropterin synthase [Micromonospora nigra]SCL13129.1 6-pyruvoyltetrahydropterin/6-carboxytetrahydropterin synthase [Micromonospora nigra]